MRKNKALSLLLFSLIVLSIVNFYPFNGSVYAISPKPRLESIVAEGLEGYNGLNFEVGTLITVEYSVDRYSGVDGVMIIGQGSGLDLNLSAGLVLNHTHDLKSRSYYKGIFNLTENTFFKGYGWIGELSNGTYETVEVFNHLEDWHYLYINNHTPPDFEVIINATETTPGVFYSPMNQINHTIVIRYRVYGGLPNESVTLALSVYRDKISDASRNVFDGDVTFIPMQWVNETHTNYEVFNTTITLTERTLYFSANNSYGWDSWSSNNILTTKLNIYQIYNGFYFESKTQLNEPYTDIDDLLIRIYSYNSTPTETFGVGFYVIESYENRTEVQNWTMINATLESTYNLSEGTGFNTTVREFTVSLGTFNVGNVIFFEAYNIYYGEFYNETNGNYHSVEIFDSIPQLSIDPIDGFYTNNIQVNFTFSIDYVRGNITGILFDFGDGSPVANLTDSESYFILHSYPADVTAAYDYALYVNSSLGTSNNLTQTIYLDFTAPELTIDSSTNNNSVITDGYVELHFTYQDDYSGVQKIFVDWGDGTILNATGKNFVFHNYVKTGNYTITITIEDKAGNSFSTFLYYSIEIAVFTPPVITPFNFGSIIIAFVLIVGIVYYRKKRY
ncbi:MAG: PKD domain-containing protein [Candidatus Heimdallarchaeaceae archaeon]